MKKYRYEIIKSDNGIVCFAKAGKVYANDFISAYNQIRLYIDADNIKITIWEAE